jgi:hypothetical protein
MFNDLFVLSEFALNANGIPPPGDAGLDLNNMEWDGTVFASGSFLGIDIVEANIAFTHLGVTDVSATLEAQMADLHLTADISVPNIVGSCVDRVEGTGTLSLGENSLAISVVYEGLPCVHARDPVCDNVFDDETMRLISSCGRCMDTRASPNVCAGEDITREACKPEDGYKWCTKLRDTDDPACTNIHDYELDRLISSCGRCLDISGGEVKCTGADITEATCRATEGFTWCTRPRETDDPDCVDVFDFELQRQVSSCGRCLDTESSPIACAGAEIGQAGCTPDNGLAWCTAPRDTEGGGCKLTIEAAGEMHLPALQTSMTGVVVSLTAGSSSGAGCSLDLWSGDISGAVTIGNLYVDGAITITDNVMTALVMAFEYTQPGLFDVTATIEYELNPDGSTRFFGMGTLDLHIADAPLSLQAEVLALKPAEGEGASTFQLVVASQSEPWSMFNNLFVLSEFALNADGVMPPGTSDFNLNNMEWDPWSMGRTITWAKWFRSK